MPFVPIAALAALVLKFTDLSKRITSSDFKGAATIVYAWAAGVLALVLVSATVWADGIKIGDQALSHLNFASLIFLGASVGSVGGVVFDFKKARDNTDTAVEPPFFGASQNGRG